MIAAAGCVLAASGCFGFVFTIESSAPFAEALGMALFGLFVLGVLALPVGFVWWLVGMGRTRKAQAAAAASAEIPIGGPHPPEP